MCISHKHPYLNVSDNCSKPQVGLQPLAAAPIRVGANPRSSIDRSLADTE